MFIKLYLDIFGLYIGGYIAWIILGLAGASRSPVWNPKNKMNQSEEKKKNKELKKAEKKSKNEPATLPANHLTQSTPSNQPAGTPLPGPKRAVMPVTSSNPAKPAPATNETREDDKPLKKSIREGLVVAKKTKQQTAI